MNTFADKLARKAFEEPAFQRSWQVHMGTFGPVLEGCFREDYQAKIHLCAALNHISRRECDQGAKKLELAEKRCASDADHAAAAFFRGLCHQMAGEEGPMLRRYQEAIDGGLRFYMPYMKLAKAYQLAGHPDRAVEYYRGAISCFDGMGLGEGEKLVLGSAYTGLATCLTELGRYPDAERALESSRHLYPEAPGRSAIEAVLCAVRGDRETAEQSLKVLLSHAPQAYEQTRAAVRAILDHTY